MATLKRKTEPRRKRAFPVSIRLTEEGFRTLRVLAEYAGGQAQVVELLLQGEYERLKKRDHVGLHAATKAALKKEK